MGPQWGKVDLYEKCLFWAVRSETCVMKSGSLYHKKWLRPPGLTNNPLYSQVMACVHGLPLFSGRYVPKSGLLHKLASLSNLSEHVVVK